MTAPEKDLDEGQLALLENELRGRIAALQDEVRDERAGGEDERSRRSVREVRDRGDEASTEQWREANAAMIGHHEDEILSIKAALARLGSGTYGYCVSCGEPIGFNRLKAYPSASRCLNCQSRAESH